MLEEVCSKSFGVKLNIFQPRASYYEDMDYVEYVSCEDIAVAERIDEFLTILWDKNQDNVIGFKLKGFRHFFEKTLKPLYDLKNEEFVSLTSALEILYTMLGNNIIQSQDIEAHNRKNTEYAYRQAMLIAEKNKVNLYDIPEEKIAA